MKLSDEKVSVKLPKLKITKFEGIAIDWFQPWNKFETEIDQVQKVRLFQREDC